MLWAVVADWAEAWMRAIGRASLWGGLAIGGAWLICRWLPRMSPNARSWIWRLVYLKLCLLLLWPGPFHLPLFSSPALQLERTAAPAAAGISEPQGAPRPEDSTLRSESSLPSGAQPRFATLGSVLLFGIWLSAVVRFAIGTMQNRVFAGKVLRESQPITDLLLQEQCRLLSHQLGLKKPPGLRSLETVPGPLAAGLLRPVIVFPASFAERFSTQEIRLMLAHELAHLQRHDLFWVGLRRIVKSVLFFHPLVWVAQEQATLAEEIACDEIALAAVNAPVADYARTLLRVMQQGLLGPAAALVGVGAGMGLSCRMMACRLQALPLTRSLACRVARWKRRRATLLGCVGLVVLLPVGFITCFHTCGIQQIATRYRVLGFKVSRGRNHSLSVQREVCTFAGFRLSRVVEQASRSNAATRPESGAWASAAWNTDSTAPGSGTPARVAGWLRRLGVPARLDSHAYTSAVSDPEESCAVIVRFEHDPLCTGYEAIEACLVDERGETISLAPDRSEFPPGSGEYVKFWVIRPAPITRAKFKLLLRQTAEGRDIAVLRLGKL
jgi:beta-lactamase regulating signal transducer with metallopeptidase domain